MMGRSHALSGGVSWLAGCAVLSAAGARPPAVAIWAGAAVATGFALLPDVDHTGSTVARTLGPLTHAAAGVVAWTSTDVRSRSCPHCAGRGDSGHRGITHTALGAVVAGLVVSVCAWLFGQIVAAVVAGFGVWLAAHSALSSPWRARIGDMILPGRFRSRGPAAHRFTAGVGALLLGAAAAGALHESASGSWWWIGLPVFWGCLAHSLGDALTFSRVPLLWPLEIRGCRWTPVGSPRWLRFRTGSTAEKAVVVLLAVCGVGALAVLGGAG